MEPFTAFALGCSLGYTAGALTLTTWGRKLLVQGYTWAKSLVTRKKTTSNEG